MTRTTASVGRDLVLPTPITSTGANSTTVPGADGTLSMITMSGTPVEEPCAERAPTRVESGPIQGGMTAPAVGQ